MKALDNPSYKPNALMNRVLEMMNFESDNQLAKALHCHRSQICGVRSKRIGISAKLLLALHDLTGLPAKELRKWGGME
jgi:hypothetical protein